MSGPMTHPSTRVLFKLGIRVRGGVLKPVISVEEKALSTWCSALLHPVDLHTHQMYSGEQCGGFGKVLAFLVLQL